MAQDLRSGRRASKLLEGIRDWSHRDVSEKCVHALFSVFYNCAGLHYGESCSSKTCQGVNKLVRNCFVSAQRTVSKLIGQDNEVK